MNECTSEIVIDVVTEPFCSLEDINNELQYIASYQSNRPKGKDLVLLIQNNLKSLPLATFKPSATELRAPLIVSKSIPTKGKVERRELK